jgi:hypothetical protein
LFGPHRRRGSIALVVLSLLAEVVELIFLENHHPDLSLGVDWGYVAAEETGLVVVTMAGLEERLAVAMTEGLEELFVPSFQKNDSVVVSPPTSCFASNKLWRGKLLPSRILYNR